MEVEPFSGKTYTLYSSVDNTDAYFDRIRSVADLCLARHPDTTSLISIVQNAGRHKRRLKKLLSSPLEVSLDSFLAHILRANLAEYTARVAGHLKELPLTKSWDRTIAMREEEYHLAMLEVELTNRLNVGSFRQCGTRLAFLPHCLHDLAADCHSVKRGEDYICKGCSKNCNVNAVSKLLRRHGVMPYIWMTANLRALFKRLRKEGKKVGVIGVACIPELMHGMRMCMRAGVPVVGVPLDANRCARWWGEFHPNTINLRELETLLGDETLKTTKNYGGLGVRRRQVAVAFSSDQAIEATGHAFS